MTKTKTQQRGMRLKEVARATGLHVNTIRNLSDTGIIQATRDVNGWRIFDPSVVPFLVERYTDASIQARNRERGREIARFGNTAVRKLLVHGPAVERFNAEMEATGATKFMDLGFVIQWESEPVCSCEHLFHKHTHSGDAIDRDGHHACTVEGCFCAGWKGYVACPQCQGTLSEDERPGCDLTTVVMFAWTRGKPMYWVVSRCTKTRIQMTYNVKDREVKRAEQGK